MTKTDNNENPEVHFVHCDIFRQIFVSKNAPPVPNKI